MSVMFETDDSLYSATCGSVICAIQWFLQRVGFTSEGAKPVVHEALAVMRKAKREGAED